jgi:flagellin
MSLVLNTNIASLNAQRNLTTSQASLAQALQRLSSGLRINSAADDAAGLAISQQFTTQINGTNQAINNANDAVSEAQTAGGALSTLTNNLQSIRTLAVEAANGSNSASDRAALDQQVQQQIAEITQIASQTTFNGANVLDGSSGVTTYQVGANVGNTIAVNLSQGVRADQIGQVASQTTTATTNAFTGGLLIAVGNGTPLAVGSSNATAVAGTASAGQTAGSAYAKAAAINSAGIAGLTASAATTVNAAFTTIVAATAGTGVPTTAATASTYDLSINGTSIYSGAGNIAVGSSLNVQQVAAQINLYSSQDGNVTASVTNNQLTLTASDGQDITIVQAYTAGAAAAGGSTAGSTAGTAANAGATQAGISSTATGAYAGGTTTQINAGSVTLSADSNITLGGTAADLTAAGLTAGTISLSGSKTLASQNVLTVAGANATIAAVDSALATVSSFDSQLGAIQNRFTAAVSNLTSTSQNLTQSRSTLEDTNFAAETANLTQSNVLEQAGISVLAQANQQPQLILKLLQ